MRIRSKTLTKVAAWLATMVVRLLFRTCRLVVLPDPDARGAFNKHVPKFHLFVFWHDSILIPIFCKKHTCMAGLVSRHQDGSYLAESMKALGILPVRGSSKRGGDRAIREIFDVLQNWHIAITPDGPRGPRHEMKDGAIYIASRTGTQIVAIGCKCSRAWRPKGNWTDLIIPKPFSTIYTVTSEPITIPPDLTRDGIAHYRGVVQAELERAYAQADRLAAGLPFEETERKVAA